MSTAFFRFPGSEFIDRLSENYAWGPRSGVDTPYGVDFMGNRNRVLFLTGLLSQLAQACSTEPNGEISTMIREAYKKL